MREVIHNSASGANGCFALKGFSHWWKCVWHKEKQGLSMWCCWGVWWCGREKEWLHTDMDQWAASCSVGHPSLNWTADLKLSISATQHFPHWPNPEQLTDHCKCNRLTFISILQHTRNSMDLGSWYKYISTMWRVTLRKLYFYKQSHQSPSQIIKGALRFLRENLHYKLGVWSRKMWMFTRKVALWEV